MKACWLCLAVAVLAVVVGAHVGGFASLVCGLVALGTWANVLRTVLTGKCYSDGTCICL